MTFQRRFLQVTFTLGLGKSGQRYFTESLTNNVIKLNSQLRASARISKAGSPALNRMDLSIWGLTLSEMNNLSTLGLVPNLYRQNYVTVEASNDGGKTFSTVFTGTYVNGYADFEGMPDCKFTVVAATGLVQQVAPGVAFGIKGSSDVAAVMKILADAMHLTFENNGVNAQYPDIYLDGSYLHMARSLAEKAGIQLVVDDTTLAICPTGTARFRSQIPLISADNGMVGYPIYNSQGIMVKTEFNPAVLFLGQIEVKSSLQDATGIWNVYSIDHFLDAQVFHGDWHTQIGAYRGPNRPIPS
jgi:hypothetical protein